MGRGDMRDMDIERVLREHFKAEASELRAPRDPWAWVESRLEPTPRPRLLGRLIGNRRGPFYAVSGALAAAVMSVVAIVAAVGMWSVFIGPQSPAGDQGLRATQVIKASVASKIPKAHKARQVLQPSKARLRVRRFGTLSGSPTSPPLRTTFRPSA